MTATVRDEIVRLAAAWAHAKRAEGLFAGSDMSSGGYMAICRGAESAETAFRAYVDAALAQAVAREREACAVKIEEMRAKVLDMGSVKVGTAWCASMLNALAAAIRSETQADGEKNG